MTITVERMSGADAVKAEDAFALVYAEAFAEPPYNKSEKDVEANFRRFRSQVRKATFRAALARAGDGEPIGMAYGYPLSPATGWWGRLTTPVPDELRREDAPDVRTDRTCGARPVASPRRGPAPARGSARRCHGGTGTAQRTAGCRGGTGCLPVVGVPQGRRGSPVGRGGPARRDGPRPAAEDRVRAVERAPRYASSELGCSGAETIPGPRTHQLAHACWDRRRRTRATGRAAVGIDG